MALLIGCMSPAWSAGHALELNLDQMQLSGDLHAVSCLGLDEIRVGRDLSLPAQHTLVELHDNESLADITWATSGRELLGGVAADDRFDEPTSLDHSYAHLRRRIAEENRLGASPVVVEGEFERAGRRYARILLLPVTVDSAGQLLLYPTIDLKVGARSIERAELLPLSILDGEALTAPQRAASAGEVIDYVMVTNRDLAESFEPLAAYRNETGLRTEVVVLDSILVGQTGRDDAERLREYLKQFYAQGGRYVLMGGDSHVLPLRYAYDLNADSMPSLEDQQVCDLYFADLTGTWDVDGDGVYGEPSDDRPDVRPELYLGRAPFNMPEQVSAYVAKVIRYETNPGNDDPTYLGRSFFFCSDQMRDISGGEHNVVARAFPATITADTVTGIEQSRGDDPSPYNLPATELLPVLSQGYGVVNIIAHGAFTKFGVRSAGYNNLPISSFRTDTAQVGTDQITRLVPNGRVSLYYSLACDNGAFDKNGPPFNVTQPNVATALLSLPEAGAVAFVANSRWGWVSLSYLLQKTFFDSLFAHPDRPAVAAVYAAKAVHYYCRDLVYGQIYFGDPALRVYRGVPTSMRVAVHPTVDSVIVLVTSGGTAAADADLLVACNEELIGQYRTDGTGRVALVNDLVLGSTYTFSAVAVGASTGQASYTPTMATDIGDEPGTLPAEFALAQNYPNPFNPATVIAFDLPRGASVRLVLFNALGQEVARLKDGHLPAGHHEVTWEATDQFGRELASGVYFSRLEADGAIQTRKMLLVR